MKKRYFSWLPHRITERQSAKKARNIKGNRLRNSRSTASRLPVALPSSASADLSAGFIKMPPIWAAFCLRSFRAPSQMGRRFAPYKRFGPGAQNLGAGGIHFRRACKVSGGPKDRLSKKRLCRFFEKDHMAEGFRFLAKKSPLPP